MAKCWNCGSENALDEATACASCAQAHELERQEEARAAQEAWHEREAQEAEEEQAQEEAWLDCQAREETRSRLARERYRDAILAGEWAEFEVQNQGKNSLVKMFNARDFQKSLEFRYEWLRHS